MSSVPPGGLILVTGANGYLASVTIAPLLQRGYSVRGTVRSLASHTWMSSHFGHRFELVEVPDIYADDAFETKGLLDGVQGIAHMAMNTSMDPKNHAIIQDTVKSTLRLLEAAARTSSVKSVVVTSSLAACALPTTGEPYTINPSTWNTDAITKTRNPLPDIQSMSPISARWHGITLYAASKALSEQASFTWVDKHNPSFRLNTVVPNVNFGIAISPTNMGYRSTAAVLDAVVKGYPAAPSILPSQWFVDVEDTALLHLAALILPEVQGERLLAFAGRYSWTQILQILHRRYPDRIMLKALPLEEGVEEVVDKGTVDNRRSIEVLKMMGKVEGFTSLEDTLVKAMETIFENQDKNVPKTRIDLYYESLAQAAG